MEEYREAVSALENAVEAWGDAIEGVADALCGLDELDEDNVPEVVKRALGLAVDGGFQVVVADARRLEPDQSPPQELRDIVETLSDAGEACEDEEGEEDDNFDPLFPLASGKVCR